MMIVFFGKIHEAVIRPPQRGESTSIHFKFILYDWLLLSNLFNYF